MPSYPDAMPNRRSMDAQERKWRSERDFSTLQDAEEVRGDKSRHRDALTHGRMKMRAMKRVVAASGRSSSRSKARR